MYLKKLLNMNQYIFSCVVANVIPISQYPHTPRVHNI